MRPVKICDALELPEDTRVYVRGRVRVTERIGDMTLATINDDTGIIRIAIHSDRLEEELAADYLVLLVAGNCDIMDVDGTITRLVDGDVVIEVISFLIVD
jgi:lysyl-tRNA synthetase class II